MTTANAGSVSIPHLGTVVDLGVSEQWGRAAATFSEDRRYRYALDRVWDKALPVTCFVMLNPSTADAFKVDPTVNRCLGFAKAWGSGGLVVLNAFALRSTDPKALYGHPDPVGPQNDRIIRETLERLQPAQVVAAWGHHAAKVDATGRKRPRKTEPGHFTWRSRAHDIGRMLRVDLSALAITKDGHPGHPLYILGDTVPVPWRPA